MIATYTERRGGTRIWDQMSYDEQVQANKNRRAMGLQPRPLTAERPVVTSAEQPEEDHVSERVGA